ncbi:MULTISPECIES: DNA polymerase III subunit delta [Olivibacter]|jgi:DNA polymerase-3 subunit delta|uniref:DNA polymerase III subunit delta n=3 Tax=Sphingobacteriaceae TaxID=84566 RepID=F4CEB8_SPHS2|nr:MULTISPECIES: DNA polymerase III subunit delta [Olivibacter]MCL4640678.1 DNA polymerase III subunit delta [Olivibacter sp. UJ_SKK_5.1]MDM8176243.1 DNA polymerase III subunit delta [Olivibacter sp. 47]MDX3915786.1 DNA polymerase III subunit delta [Pseudosphingobacterium sp.]QEL01006.1 DNA polymerase III subunit delta [Olivibacter sp. LS-1]
MSASNILADINKRKLKPIYLLHGEEAYYIDLIVHALENKVLSEAEKGFNQTILYGKDTDWVTILNTAKRYPMMSDYQVVIIKEAQNLKWDKADEFFQAYVEKPLTTTVLAFAYKYSKFDKRKKIYKAIEKSGVVLESAKIYDNKLAPWIDEYVKERGMKIHPQAAAMMGEYLGTELSKVANELDKMMLNVPKDREIGVTDVQNNIGISKDFNIFELNTALGKKDVLKVNQIIDYFSANPKSNPIPVVMGSLYGYFSKILKFHYLPDKSQQSAAKELGVHPFFVKDYELAARNYPIMKLFHIIGYLREYDLKSKGVDAFNLEAEDLLKEMMFKVLH